MDKGHNDRQLTVCDECKSEYFGHTSAMERLCPECARLLYGYETCQHVFINGRCKKCYWNGHTSEYLKTNFGNPDSLTRAMQNEAIRIATERLGHPLPVELIIKVRTNKWSYMGLEMIIDTVRTIKVSEIESYLSKLD